MKTVALIVGGLVGGIAGYSIIVYVSCWWLWPQSNMCGIWGCFIGGPGGLIAGTSLAGWLLRRSGAVR